MEQSIYSDMNGFDYEQTMFMYDVQNIKHEPTDTCSESSESPVYTDLSAAEYSPSKFTLMKQEKTVYPDVFDNLLSWTSKHPEHWTHREVLDWVYYVAEVKSFDCSQFYGERYQTLTGQKLCRMSKSDFTAMDSHYGVILYDLFRSLLQKSKFCEPLPPDSMNPDAYPFLDTTYPCLPVPYSSIQEAPGSPSEDLPVFVNESGVAVDIDGVLYDIDIGTKIDIADDKEKDCGYISGGSEMDEPVQGCDSPISDPFEFGATNDSDVVMQTSPPCSPFPHMPRKRTMSNVSSNDDLNDKSAAQRRRITSTSKGNHLWEFIRDLLKDPNLNPSLLKWEDKETGVFKFVQSEAVANMWGRKKNNPGMTYEKLSRAMRFCRSAGYFGDVPKNGKFPKKLCFRFGPKAHDWK